MKINFFLDDWHTLESNSYVFYYKGNFIYREILVSPEFIFSKILEIGYKVLDHVDGFFSFIFYDKAKKDIFASVDLIRSIPLFYSFTPNEELTFFSRIKKDFDKKYEVDVINRDLFLLSSYVPGNETLLKGIKQLTAGNFLKFKDFILEDISYFRFQAMEPKKFNEIDFENKLNRVTRCAFQKLINYADGRQIVVPLSGGYDSRLIVSMLKELNYLNVICFSYGVKGNLEAEYSRKIAESLDYKWIFIEYTNEKWEKNWGSNLSKEYVDFSANKTSLPHIQDWIAVKELKENSLIDKDAIFVPGHCCVTGYIDQSVLKISSNKDNILNTLMNKHYILLPINETSLKNKKNLKIIIDQKIFQQLDYEGDLCSNIMEFNWKERQSKYIANSVRVYEFFGFTWWMPLWDRNFMDCWINVPNDFRVDRVFFKKWVSQKYSKQSNINSDLGNAGAPSLLYRIAKKFISIIFSANLSNKIKAIYRKNEYSNHHLGLGDIINKKDRDELTRRGYKVLGIYTKKYLNGEWGE